MTPASGGILVRRVAAPLAVIGTITAAVLHIVFCTHAGALWRDEVNSLNLATVNTLSELWANLSFDSFPVSFFIVLRLFAGVPATVSDMELRIFGAVIGLLILAALWLNARWLGFRVPLISVALVGVNPMVIRYGDSIRAYGLGILLVLLCVGTMWRFVVEGSWTRFVSALVAAVLSVQCLYYNSFLLFAICMGASAVCLRRRDYRRIAMILSIGIVAAASLIVYLPTIREVGKTNIFWKGDFTVSLFWKKLSETLGSPIVGTEWLWIGLFFFALIAGSWFLFARVKGASPLLEKDLLLFSLITLLVGTVGYITFLFYLSYMTQPWYYVVFVAFIGSCLEAIVGAFPGRSWALRGSVAVLLIGLTAQPAWVALQFRQTNIDAIASELEASAATDDLILVNTWNYAIPLRRYYHGNTTCATVPPIADLRWHRMDLVYQQVFARAPMAPVLNRMEETLRAGHTIWLIGALKLLPPGQTPLQREPGQGGFYRAWSEQAGSLVANHADELVRIQPPIKNEAVIYENLPLSAIRGWHETGGLTVR